MQKLLEGVFALKDKELQMANENYPLFSSDHEGSAVIREEIEEAELEMENIKYYYSILWDSVKCDSDIDYDADKLKIVACKCAAECIQVAAMCEKIKLKKK